MAKLKRPYLGRTIAALFFRAILLAKALANLVAPQRRCVCLYTVGSVRPARVETLFVRADGNQRNLGEAGPRNGTAAFLKSRRS